MASGILWVPLGPGQPQKGDGGFWVKPLPTSLQVTGKPPAAAPWGHQRCGGWFLQGYSAGFCF